MSYQHIQEVRSSVTEKEYIARMMSFPTASRHSSSKQNTSFSIATEQLILKRMMSTGRTHSTVDDNLVSLQSSSSLSSGKSDKVLSFNLPDQPPSIKEHSSSSFQHCKSDESNPSSLINQSTTEDKSSRVQYCLKSDESTPFSLCPSPTKGHSTSSHKSTHYDITPSISRSTKNKDLTRRKSYIKGIIKEEISQIFIKHSVSRISKIELVFP